MDETPATHPNRAQRRQTVKATRVIKDQAKDKVAVRRAHQLAEKIPLQNLNTVGSAKSAASVGTSDQERMWNQLAEQAIPTDDPPDSDLVKRRPGRPPKQQADVAPADFTPPPGPEGGKKWKDTDEIVQGLCMVYGLATIPLMQVEPYDGLVIMNNAEASASSLELVSRRHKRMRKVLKMIAAGNVYAVAISTNMGIAVAIAVHHNLLNARFNEPFAGTWTPEKDPQTWAAMRGESSPLPSSSATSTAASMPFSVNFSNGSSNGSQSSAMPPSPTPPIARDVAQMSDLMRQAATLQPGMHNLAAAASSYDPSDTAQRPEQNPAFLPELARRDR